MVSKFFPKFHSIGKIKTKKEIIDSVGGYGKRDPWERFYLSSPFPKKNLYYFLFFVFFSIFILSSRLFYLQIIKGDYYFYLAEGNRIRNEVIKAKRGVIYDKNYRQIAFNDPNFSLVITPSLFYKNKGEDFFQKCLDNFNHSCFDNTIDYINSLFIVAQNSLSSPEKWSFKKKIKKEELFSKINNNFSKEIIIVEKIPYNLSLPLLITTKNIKGLKIKIDSARFYNFPLSFSHIVGYIGRITTKEIGEYSDYLPNDYIGKNGLEKYYEPYLRGKDGFDSYEVDALGKKIRITKRISPLDGNSLVLTVDINWQKKMEEILKKHLRQANKKRAVAIALNPQNGEVIGMVSWPSFSSNQFAYRIDPQIYQELLNDEDKPLFNRAIMGEYPSGSIIKPVIASALLQEKVITPRTTFLSTGGIRVGKWFFPDWKAGGHGRVNVVQAIAHSVNTFFYIGVGGYNKFSGLGLEKLKEYEEKFGINQKTGIDLPYEADGFFPTKEWKKQSTGEPWYIGDTYHLAIGQGYLLITPLQGAVFASIIANRGTYYRPFLVKKIIKSNRETVKEFFPKIIRKDFIDKENIETARKGMRACVLEGSCRLLSGLPFKSAGKTGTAQTSKEPHSWFIAFAPWDTPQIALAVLVENGGEGHELAEPIAKEMLEEYFNDFAY